MTRVMLSVVTFGDPNMSINRDDPQRKKKFSCKTSMCDKPVSKHKARYWSCFQWKSSAKVDN